MKLCASSMTPRRKIFRMSRCRRPMEDTVTAKASPRKGPTIIITGIFRIRMTFTSSTLRLTTGSRKQRMMMVATLSIQKATFLEQNQQGDQNLKVSSNTSSNNLAKQIVTGTNTPRTTNTMENINHMSIRMKITNNLMNSRRSSTIETLETIQTSTKPIITGPTSKRIGTRFRQTLNEEPSGLQSLAITLPKKTQPFMPRTEATHKKT